MKAVLSILFIALCISFQSSGQADSSVVYYAKGGKQTTKDSSIIYTVYTRKDSLWYGRCFFTKNNVLQSEGTYREKTLDTPIGKFDNFNEEGVHVTTNFYVDGKLQQSTYYFPGGKKKSYIAFSPDGYPEEQKGWDESGTILPGYIVMREAEFKGGLKGWKKYLEKNLDANVPGDAGAPDGTYSVSVIFLVDPQGNISEVSADTIPALCKPCAAEAVRVIRDGPNWEPAILNNEPVKYYQRQRVTFVLITEQKKRRGRN
jgi:antitoxin component YwqK of YwqJK toxin-antitoxin module